MERMSLLTFHWPKKITWPQLNSTEQGSADLLCAKTRRERSKYTSTTLIAPKPPGKGGWNLKIQEKAGKKKETR